MSRWDIRPEILTDRGSGFMTHSRGSIARLMVLIAVIALDLTAIRQIFWGDGIFLELSTLFGPIVLALQLGIGRLVSGNRLHRSFWLGFVSGGLLAGFWFVAALLTR